MDRITRPDECECHLYAADAPPCGSEECGGDEAVGAFFAGRQPAKSPPLVIDAQ